jgi:hypothetical protein
MPFFVLIREQILMIFNNPVFEKVKNYEKDKWRSHVKLGNSG